MRLIRWVIGGLVALAAVVLVAGAFWPGSSHDCPTQSLAAPYVSFVGTAQAKDGSSVTFEVESWSADRIPPGSAQVLSPGDTVVISYRDGDERFLHAGQRYQVDAWGHGTDDLASDVHTPGECGPGSGTRRADGSNIDTSLWTRDGIEPYQGRLALGALVLGIVVVATVAYRRVTHPRLTIDGHARR